MPFYEYQCTACSHQLEALQKISDEPLQYCPECGAAELKKLISKAAFRLKGSGWYETDFKNSDSKKQNTGKESKKKTDNTKTTDSKGSGSKDSGSKDSSSKSSSSGKSNTNTSQTNA